MVGWAKSLNDEYLNEQQYRMNQVIYLLTMVGREGNRQGGGREGGGAVGQVEGEEVISIHTHCMNVYLYDLI